MLSLLLIISIAVNILLIGKNKALKSQINYLKFKHLKKMDVKTAAVSINKHNDKDPWLNKLELELDKEITLETVKLNDTVELKDKRNSKKSSQMDQIIHTDSFLYTTLQSLSGWHKSLIPFLLQNIGWFIGILCFISGSLFFVSYTEGFSKSLTIFFTILSYTLLLTWSGYHLKEKVAHASTSGMVLLAISFLLVPLNFSAAGRLLTISLEHGSANIHSIIALISVLSASIILFYITKLISGLFNRQLLRYFSPVFFSLSAIQLVVPMVHNSQSIIMLLTLFLMILTMLFIAFVYYLPTVLKQVFVDKKYLVLFSISTLIFSAINSIIHISLSSQISIALSYYAPVILLISAVLFYMDEQLNEYNDMGSLLSYLSLVSYALSFAAVFLSIDTAMIRMLIIPLSIVLYLRLIWLYRSLVPLYLVIVLLGFLYMDIFLLNQEFILTIALQWLYLSLLPLIALFSVMFVLLRKSELQREKSFHLTRHLLHFIFIISVLSGAASQWNMQLESLVWVNSYVLIISLYFMLKSSIVRALELLGLKQYTAYTYVLTLLPVIFVLSNQFISIESRLTILTMMTLFYSLNSHYVFFKINDNKRLECSIFINSSLIISLLLIVLIVLDFSLTIKVSILLFVISLNTLFLSISLYNRALFYIFMLLVSLSALVIKLHINSASTGFLLLSVIFLLYYFIHYLQAQAKENSDGDELESIRVNSIQKYPPEKLLWFYPVNDLSEQLLEVKNEGFKND